MLDQKTIRKLLLTAVVVALATTPAAAKTAANCESKESHYGLFCNDGGNIEDMRLGDALEVTATPTFFYRFGKHVGYADEEQLVELIERAR